MKWNRFGLALLVLCLAACGAKDESGGSPPPSGSAGAPPAGAQAPFAGMNQDPGPVDGHALPIKLTGNNSLIELTAGREAAASPEAAALFESGFRKAFTADQTKRDYPGAERDLTEAIALDPNLAQAYRALGYARFNQGFNTQAAFENYGKALELKPDYGETWYALAFLYAQSDRAKGAEAFKKAMELGVPDERKLGERFYPGN